MSSSGRLALVRKQYHFWPGEHGLNAWDVDRLVALSQGLPVVEIALADIDELDSNYWFDHGEQPTVRRIVEHFRLTQAVDMSFPVILGPDGRVMDGMHRIARALLEDRPSIAAVRLPATPDPDFIACRPEDLPY